MRKLLIAAVLCLLFVIPAEASQLTAPSVPASGAERMPENTDSCGQSLLELLSRSMESLAPDLKEAAESCASILFSALLFSFLPLISSKGSETASMAGAAAISAVLFQKTHHMIRLATDTVTEILEYGKLLCPVMTAALAAQGGVSASSALYVGTTMFITLLSTGISRWIVPMLYFHLAFSLSGCALGDEMLKKATVLIKSVLTWILKTSMVIFTTYLSITGVVSGTTDLAALKAAKVAFSSFVPVVGSILSDSSEAVLVSMGIMKNAAGIYGILAVLAVFLGPFLKIAAHYMLMKATAGLCAVFGEKRFSAITEEFASTMGFLMGILSVGCVLVLISTICFLKGTAL